MEHMFCYNSSRRGFYGFREDNIGRVDGVYSYLCAVKGGIVPNCIQNEEEFTK